MPAIRKALLVGTRTELAKRSPVIRLPRTVDEIRAEIASLEHHYGVSTRDLKRGQHVPRHVVSRWLSLHTTLLRLEYERADAARASEVE
jgi:hypothetical protein